MKKIIKFLIPIVLIVALVLIFIFKVIFVNVNANYNYYEFILENNFNNNLFTTKGKINNVDGVIYTKNNNKEFYNIKSNNAYLSVISNENNTFKTHNYVEKDYENIDLNQLLVLINNKIKDKRYFINSIFKVDLTSEEFINLTHITYSYELNDNQITIDSSNPYCLVNLNNNDIKSIKCISNNDYIKLDISNINQKFTIEKETALNNFKQYSFDIAKEPKSYKVNISDLLEEVELSVYTKLNIVNYNKDNNNYKIYYDLESKTEYLTNIDNDESSILDSNNLVKDLYSLIYSYYSKDNNYDKNKTICLDMNNLYKTLNKVLINKYQESEDLVKCNFARSGNVVILVNCDNGLSLNFSLFNDLK